MADSEVFRIEIPVQAIDQTEPALGNAQKKLSKFEQSMARTENQMKKLNRTKMQMILGAIDKASGVIASVGSKARSLAGKTWNITLRVLDLATKPFRAFMNFATSAIGMITAGAGITGGIVIPMKLQADYEQTQIAFETLLKSTEKAKQFLAEAQTFANKTPFEFPELINSSKLLLAFGFDVKKVMPMMQTIGDTASGLGAGAEGIDRITRALGQMQAKGRIQAEEMLQLQELGVPAAQILQEELGMTAKQVANIGNESVSASKGVEALLAGMNKRFGGMMSKQSQSAIGLMSTIQDTIKNNWLRKWGEGLWSGVKPALNNIVTWMDKNQDKVAEWGEQFRKVGEQISVWVVGKLDKVKQRISGLTNSTEWKNATTLGEKMKLAWDKVIKEPFQEWWGSKGKEWVTKAAADMGSALGGGLGNFIMSALGVAADPSKSMNESPFISAGTTAGKAFVDAFAEAFDANKIAQKLLEAIQAVGKDAAKVMPGGEDPTGTSWLSAILAGWAGGKLFKGGAKIAKGGKGIWSIFSKIFGKAAPAGATAAAAGSGAAAAAETAAAAATTAASAAKTVAIYGANGEVLATVAQTAAAAETTAAAATSTAGAASTAAATAGEAATAVGGLGAAATGAVVALAAIAALYTGKSVSNIFGVNKATTAMGAQAKADSAAGTPGYWNKPIDKQSMMHNATDPFNKQFWSGVNTSDYYVSNSEYQTLDDAKKKELQKIKGEQIMNQIQNGNWKPGKIDLLGHASGGILTRPHMGMVAEAGPEAVIPLSGGKRARGIDLWLQSGRALGINPDATRGQQANAASGRGRGTMKIDLQVSPKFEVTSTASAAEVLAAIKSHAGEIAEDLSDQLADVLAKIFDNMPQEEGA